jgi:hypothetical protein
MPWRFPSTWPEDRRTRFIEAAKRHWPRRTHINVGAWVALFKDIDWAPRTLMKVKRGPGRRLVREWVEIPLTED